MFSLLRVICVDFDWTKITVHGQPLSGCLEWLTRTNAPSHDPVFGVAIPNLTWVTQYFVNNGVRMVTRPPFPLTNHHVSSGYTGTWNIKCLAWYCDVYFGEHWKRRVGEKHGEMVGAFVSVLWFSRRLLWENILFDLLNCSNYSYPNFRCTSRTFLYIWRWQFCSIPKCLINCFDLILIFIFRIIE